MAELFIAMIIGHFVGDYLLQGDYFLRKDHPTFGRTMATQKSAPGWRGLLWCLSHCILYTAAVALFAWRADPLFLGLVFLSHFPIDRWSLASHWLKLIGGRDLLEDYASKGKYRDLEASFAAIVYTVTDNTLHAVLMWFIAKSMF